MGGQNKLRKIAVKYKESGGVPSFYVNGVYGGISPKGEIVMKFFREQIPLPESADIYVDEDGRFVKEDNKFGGEKIDVVREILVEIVLQPEHAKPFALWLQSKLEEYERLAGGR